MPQIRKRDGALHTLAAHLVVGGGTIPPDDIQAVKAMGVAEVFVPDTPLQDIVTFIRGAMRN